MNASRWRIALALAVSLMASVRMRSPFWGCETNYSHCAQVCPRQQAKGGAR